MRSFNPILRSLSKRREERQLYFESIVNQEEHEKVDEVGKSEPHRELQSARESHREHFL